MVTRTAPQTLPPVCGPRMGQDTCSGGQGPAAPEGTRRWDHVAGHVDVDLLHPCGTPDSSQGVEHTGGLGTVEAHGGPHPLRSRVIADLRTVAPRGQHWSCERRALVVGNAAVLGV